MSDYVYLTMSYICKLETLAAYLSLTIFDKIVLPMT